MLEKKLMAEKTKSRLNEGENSQNAPKPPKIPLCIKGLVIRVIKTMDLGLT